MKCVFATLILSLLSCSAACGAAYDQFSDGVAAYVRGDYKRAAVSLSAALAAPDFPLNLKATAYLDRARVEVATDRCEQALPDVRAAEALGSNLIETSELSALINICQGDDTAAVDGLTKALSTIKYPHFYFLRGLAHWEMSDFASAESDFDAWHTAHPTDPYRLLWEALAQWRGGKSEAAALDNMPKLYLQFWPVPLVDLYRGRATPESVLAAATGKNDILPVDWACEADFFVGEWQIAHNDPAGGKSLLGKAVSVCGENDIERQIAEIELAKQK